MRAKVIIKFFRKLQEDKYLLPKIFKYIITPITPCYRARYNHKMAPHDLTVRSTILQQIRCNRSGEAKDSSKSRPSEHLLLGSKVSCALDQFATGRHLEQPHLNGEIALHKSDYIPAYYERAIREVEWTSTGHSSEQYWFIICTSTGLSSDQYWSTQWPVLVEKPTLYKRIPASSPTLFSFTRRHVVYST